MAKLPCLAALTMLAAVTIPATLRAQGGFGGLGGFGGGRSDPNSLARQGQDPRGIGLSPFVSVMGLYNRELMDSPTATFFGRKDSWGANALGGISGAKNWEHTALGLGYVGSASYWPYSPGKWYQNHVGSLSGVQVVNSRFSFFGSALAGTTIGGYGGTSGFGGVGGFGSFGGLNLGSVLSGPGVPGDGLGASTSNGLVDSELYNVRTNYLAGVGGFTYRLTERWYASGSGGASFVRRKQSLFGNDWQFANGEVGYQLSRRDAIGFFAQMNWLNYPNAFGEVVAQLAGVQFSREINSRSTFRAFAGGVHIRSVFIGALKIDPAIAELLGTSTTYTVQQVERYSSSFGGLYTYTRSRASAHLRYYRGITPGNGLLLAGVRDSALASLTGNFSAKWGLNLSLVGDKASGVVGVGRKAYAFQATLGTGYTFYRQLTWMANAGWRNSYIAGTNSRSSGLFISTGIAWSPRDFALSF